MDRERVGEAEERKKRERGEGKREGGGGREGGKDEGRKIKASRIQPPCLFAFPPKHHDRS